MITAAMLRGLAVLERFDDAELDPSVAVATIRVARAGEVRARTDVALPELGRDGSGGVAARAEPARAARWPRRLTRRRRRGDCAA